MLVAATTPLDEAEEKDFLRGEQDLFEGIREKELHGDVKVYLFLLVGGHSAFLNPVETIKMNSETQQASQASKSFPWPTPIHNGGPAFPVTDSRHPNGQIEYGSNGMTLRDWFAGQALTGLLADSNASSKSLYVKDAYDLADAMLVVRERKGGVA